MSYILRPDQVESWPLHEGVEGKLMAKGQNMTGLMNIWAPKSSFAVHVHPHEQIGVCLQGIAVFTIDGKEYEVKAGDVYHIPPNVPHATRNDGDAPVVLMECFAPVREDLLRKRFEQKILD
jgi:quercetin dioxygenase-like cupin family protein